MRKLRLIYLSTTAIGLGLAAGSLALGPSPASPLQFARAQAACGPANPCAAKKNPCAAAKSCNPCAARNPCATKTPCAAANPCAASNPCAAANPCNPCNPCAGGGKAAYSSECVVPRLASACNPCAVKKNPCAAKASCNPCAAKNPCSAKNPCASAKACNPCAAKNPCGATRACNPCAASNPCAAANPCNPCGAAAAAELSDAEAKAAGNCLRTEMKAAYAKSSLSVANAFWQWPRVSTQSYQSATHGERYVENYANQKAAAYNRFEDAGKLPVGSVLAKPSFVAHGNGRLGAGPLFLMEKMPAGFLEVSGDWKYSMIMPDGTLLGETRGVNSAAMKFCYECHVAAADNDHLFFLPEEYRSARK